MCPPVLFSCLVYTHTHTHTSMRSFGHVSTAVSPLSIIRACGWCNDRGGHLSPPLISFFNSIYYPRRHERRHAVTRRSGMQFGNRRGPQLCHTSSGRPLIQQCCCCSASAVICQPLPLVFGSTEVSCVSESSSRTPGFTVSI